MLITACGAIKLIKYWFSKWLITALNYVATTLFLCSMHLFLIKYNLINEGSTVKWDWHQIALKTIFLGNIFLQKWHWTTQYVVIKRYLEFHLTNIYISFISIRHRLYFKIINSELLVLNYQYLMYNGKSTSLQISQRLSGIG